MILLLEANANPAYIIILLADLVYESVTFPLPKIERTGAHHTYGQQLIEHKKLLSQMSRKVNGFKAKDVYQKSPLNFKVLLVKGRLIH